MKKLSTLFYFVLLCGFGLNAQTLPNMSFENWDMYTGILNITYEEPSGGVWTTANGAAQIIIYTPNTEKTTDAHDGTYAAKIFTNDNLALITSGTVATGEFDASATPGQNLKMGVPFTGRPSAFKFWHKYEVPGVDSCDIYAIVHKWDGTQRVTVGEAWYRSTDQYATYTEKNIPFTYYSSDTPDSISVIFASSAGGMNFEGVLGATLYVDGAELLYQTGFASVFMTEVEVEIAPNPASSQIRFDFDEARESGQLQLFAADMRFIRSIPASNQSVVFDISDLSPGVYFYLFKDDTSNLNSGSFVVD